MRRRTALWLLLALAATAAFGGHIARSDQLYFMQHRAAMEALARDVFREGSIDKLTRAQHGEKRWLVNDVMVQRGPAASNSTTREWHAFASEMRIDIRQHDAFYERLGALGLEGFTADIENHTIQFVRRHGEKLVGFYYREAGETALEDPGDVTVIPLDRQWELRRY